ncbi:NEL-type E3 ubiquitin ligase domain-containing protein [Pseudomonas botevensis]|uniref:NEL-type E3 ubiquitin ligase domain-containing protein n=1 Tax=Pseudomonas botevensis TaxID=2842352 RepID=UPI001C3D2A4D|nr:NEL-type E3 ubiquitin ligase domain-containing protein [Pseudomonas botevensis]MBV4474294.1 hypothetical protein [Pseudomonas botevensis]
MSSKKEPAPPSTLTSRQILTVLLEATGDLETAQVLQKRLPAGLLKSATGTLEALDKTSRELHASQLKVEAELKALKSLKAFCTAELSIALAARWGVGFDVERDHLELPGAACGCATTPAADGKPATVAPATRSLLDAAMQNFSEEQTGADGFPEGSVVRVASTPSGVPGLTPAAFAGFCRELDLGQKYQQHFLQVFGLRRVDGAVVATSALTQDIATLKRQLLQFDLHMALIKAHITEAGFRMVQRLIEAGGVVSDKTLHYEGRPWIMQGIQLLGSCVWGAVVFSERSVEAFPQEKCLVYMANEPYQPLYEFPSFKACVEYLNFRLGIDSYRQYFTHCLDEDDKADFFKTFAERRSLGQVKPLSLSEPLFDFMLKSHVGKLQRDARVLAVPTADVDEDAREKRLSAYLEIGLTVANVAGLFVPVLGELMMGVAIGQLLGEVYEGVEDWSHGDQREALSHLLSVAENIVLMVVTGVGQNALKTLAIRTARKHPEFFRPFTAILNRSGEDRLWKPELDAYQLAPEAAGTLAVGGKIWIRIDYHAYLVELNPHTRTWHIQHPRRAQAYAPKVELNALGGWRHQAESSEHWTGAYTLKRIDPRLQDIDDGRLDMVRRLTDIRFDELHRLSDDNLPLPARLSDALERLRIERRLREFITEMERGEVTGNTYAQEQLHTLPKLPCWPVDRYLKVVDAQGRITATYPPTAIDDDTLSVIVSQAQLANGELLQTVIDGLYPKELEALLGEEAANNQPVLLAKKIGETVKADRRGLFEHLYQRYDQSTVPDVATVRGVYPQVPVRYAHELLKQAASVERLRLRATGRVPMELAQKVREASAAVRVDRALSGFYLTDVSNPDTEKLAVQLLPQLSGWDTSVHLEVRAQTLKGRLLESVGTKASTSANPRTLVRLKQGYEAFGSDGKSLGQFESGPDSFYQALLKTLSADQRKALGFAESKTDDAWRLRRQLLDRGLDEREGCARILAGGKFERAAPEPGCAQADPPAGSKHSRALLLKLRKLYPRLSSQQAGELLDSLGNDHLARATRVKQLRTDLGRLREALEDWAGDEAGVKEAGGVSSEVRESRRTVAAVIEDSFRRMVFAPDEFRRPVHALKLDGMRVGKLPVLPVGLNFDHVKRLSLKDMALGNDVAYFLKAFKQAESVELDKNRLTLLPEVLSHMPGLRQLSLASNQLKLNEQTLAKLSNLRTLQALNLSDNHLGATPDVSKMFDLVYLSLRNTRATELPKGLERLPNLDRVDMRGNDIQELPEWLFEAEKSFSETLNLRDNPLSRSSSVQLESYRDRVGVGMGFVENDNARLDEQSARALWLSETGGEVGEQRLKIWTALKDDPGADGLFHLLAELGNTADSDQVREDLTTRVWEVLQHTEADTALREQVFDVAANPINCTDSAAMNFSHLELAAQIRKVTGAEGASTASLLELGRGLFRLEQLDAIAAEQARKNPARDPLEVSLAYRTGLAESLNLPGQPRHMRYASLGGVTAADLDTASLRVTTAELSPAWHEFLARQPFWIDHLQGVYAREFSEARAPHQLKIQTLFDKAGSYSSADYLRQMNEYAASQAESENTLVKQITDRVQRLIDLGICVLPEAVSV